MEVRTKGIEHLVVLFEALGIGGRHKLSFPEAVDTLIELKDEIPLRYEVVESSQVGGALSKGVLTKVSLRGAEARLEIPVPTLSNLKMHLIGSGGEQLPGALYCKVLGAVPGSSTGFSIRFTSVSPEIETLLQDLTATTALADEAATALGSASSGLSA
jgi:hypothetical protein